MYTGRIVFSQLIDFLPKRKFDECVRRYCGNYRIRTFCCYAQYLCMAFAQITYRQSLRDIETCPRVMKSKLYHCGIRGKVSRNTLAKANESQDWRIYADFAHILINIARKLYATEDFGVELKQAAYTLDSTTIDLCLSLFPWAKFRKHKAAVKIHTLMDLKGSIPCFIRITEGCVHDVNILDELVLEYGSFYIIERGYIDFALLYTFTQNLSFFYHQSQRQSQLSPSLLSQGRQDYWSAMRPNDYTQRLLRIEGLSCCTSPYQLLRCRDRQQARIFNKQIFPASFDNCWALQTPLADRDFLQMDQAIPAHQNIFWYHRERSEDSNLDSHQCLRSRGHYQEGTESRVKFG